MRIRLQEMLTMAVLAVGAMPAWAGPEVVPMGELEQRIALVRDRMIRGEVPRFTEEFILADVDLRPEYPRRFSEYSGDLSGRYVGAFACMPEGAPQLHELVAHIVKTQKSDGRFGNAELKFTPDEIAKDHMALLWGNGRLLVGLLEYQAAWPHEAVLASSRQLGDFLCAVQGACADEQVAARVKDLGAAGMICFSQLIEGLVMLSNATGDPKYIECAERILPWFPKERGTQHSHGYLSTLRGVVMLYEATKKPEQLQYVEELYASLVNSPDLHPYGGVMEYFGGKYDRDEGCSESDFLRLSLQLWKVTGKAEYLERAERCLYNQFYASQFTTGDFGHHLYNAQGLGPLAGEGRAWWCCTMHGLRAFRDVLDAALMDRDGRLQVNLLTDVRWASEGRRLSVSTRTDGPSNVRLSLSAEETPEGGLPVAIRIPSWASHPSVALNAVSVEPRIEDGYLVIDTPLKRGDRLDVALDQAVRILKRDGSTVELNTLGKEPVEGMLVCGPWIMGVSGGDDPLFYGEPWLENRILVPPSLAKGRASELPEIRCRYIHGGFPDLQTVTLQPLAQAYRHTTIPFAVWLSYIAAGEAS